MKKLATAFLSVLLLAAPAMAYKIEKNDGSTKMQSPWILTCNDGTRMGVGFDNNFGLMSDDAVHRASKELCKGHGGLAKPPERNGGARFDANRAFAAAGSYRVAPGLQLTQQPPPPIFALAADGCTRAGYDAAVPQSDGRFLCRASATEKQSRLDTTWSSNGPGASAHRTELGLTVGKP